MWKKQIKNKYYHLLIMLLTSFVIAPFFEDIKTGHLILPCIVIGAILFSLRALEIEKKLFLFSLLVGTSALMFDLLFPVFSKADGNSLFRGIPIFFYTVFLIMAILLLFKKMFSTNKVTGDTIAGGISVYLLLGFLWTLFYSMIFIIDSTAFSVSMAHTAHKLIHFSFATLTTVGYGDIYPVHKMATVLSDLEAMAGQLYVAIFISRLVGLHSISLRS
jgi:hypothetical protein